MSRKNNNNFNHKKLVTAGAMVNFRDSWRIFRIMSEFVEGYEFLAGLKKEVTIFGSARLSEDNHYYKVAQELGKLLGKHGFTTITGGGPGIMEAANKGAAQTGGESVGLNIQLPFEQRINPYVKKSVAFFYFFTRKVMLTSPANAFVFFPGGFGTLDEFFEVVDNMDRGYMPTSPVVMVGKEFWQPLVDFLRKKSSREVGSVGEKIIGSWHLVETAAEAFAFIKNTKDRPNLLPGGLTPRARQGRQEADWRVFQIMAELVEGFEFLTKIKNDVTVLGTKSILPGSLYYQAAYEVGKLLAKRKMTTTTGGGPGIMEAANKGASEVGGESIGINMREELGGRLNQYLTKYITFSFPFVRKLIVTTPTRALIYFPGGLGTLHQLFELLTLLETEKISSVPLLLYDKEFWQPLISYIQTLYQRFRTIDHSDQELVTLIKEPKDVLKYL
ncbi:MAG: TIGR00730 family Rossman fold protein [bacterium]|nr:TIGR00730 family Rossman fold protein [bacterium]